MRYVIIDRGQMQVASGPLSLNELQRLVGGYIEAAFTIASGVRRGYKVTGYVNEDGASSLPPNVAVDHGPEVLPAYRVQTLYGPLVVTGLTSAGKTCELNDAELEQVSVARAAEGSLPSLVLRDGAR